MYYATDLRLHSSIPGHRQLSRRLIPLCRRLLPLIAQLLVLLVHLKEENNPYIKTEINLSNTH
jgi:hypothetical protein